MDLKKWGKFVASITALTGAQFGGAQSKDIDIVRSGYYGYTQLPVAITSEKDRLILSDSPEYVGPEGGVLSGGTIDGNGRIYFYHVNDMAEDQKIAIVLENKSKVPNKVTIHRQLQTTPSPDYFKVGRQLSRLDLEQPLEDTVNRTDKGKLKKKQKKEEVITIQPLGHQLIFGDLEKTNVKKGDLFSGIVDLTTSEETFAKVMMLPVKVKSLGASYTAKTLPIDDVRLRGTFDGAIRTLDVGLPYDTNLGGAYIEVANNREDSFLKGVDELDHNTAVEDTGNYGVSYSLTLRTAGNEAFRMYFNPQGGAYSGSFAIHTKHSNRKNTPVTTEFYHVGGKDMDYLGHKTVLDTMQMGEYHGGDIITIDFMPAGASNLPIKFLLIPEALVVN